MRDKSIALEEYARQMIAGEEAHVAEVVKMLRRPGSIGGKPAAKPGGRKR